jgi:hypothetical protein
MGDLIRIFKSKFKDCAYGKQNAPQPTSSTFYLVRTTATNISTRAGNMKFSKHNDNIKKCIKNCEVYNVGYGVTSTFLQN